MRGTQGGNVKPLYTPHNTVTRERSRAALRIDAEVPRCSGSEAVKRSGQPDAIGSASLGVAVGAEVTEGNDLVAVHAGDERIEREVVTSGALGRRPGASSIDAIRPQA